MSTMFIFGLGYTGMRLADALQADGWRVKGTGRQGTFRFEDEDAVHSAINHSTHILSCVPPSGDGDPVLNLYGSTMSRVAADRWVGYLSSTGVYGDSDGAWVDETAPVGGGRRSDRTAADLAWQAVGPNVRIFRLPGIYGPGRSALDRVRSQSAQRIALEHQVFSRIHVDDIVSAIIASFRGPPGVYNIADDEPGSQNSVIELACDILGSDWPPLLPLEEAALSPAARAFYSENRRVANRRAKRIIGWRPRYTSWREGLIACLNEEGQR